jgi:hypothetical protein
MIVRAAALLALAIPVAACKAIGAPTYTSAGVTISGCPSGAVAPQQPVELSFSVVNHSSLTWPATYLLLSPSGAMRATLEVAGRPTESIGGGITRVKAPLSPGHRLNGSIRAHLAKAAAATVNLGAWGAPSNSVSVPSSYTNPGCTLHP